MTSYFVLGVSRGIGYELLRQLSSDPNNTVIGTVRNKAVFDKKLSDDADLKGRTNIHILVADLTNYASLKQAAADTANITGGGLDHLIANAVSTSKWDAYDPIGVIANDPEAFAATANGDFSANIVSHIQLFHLFTPLIQAGNAKKVIAISSALGDHDMAIEYKVKPAAMYSILKAALNMVVAKFHAQYASEGILFMSICPGAVDTGVYDQSTEDEMRRLAETGMFASFAEYAPDFKGPVPPADSVRDVLAVIRNSSLEKGNGGAFLSHKGNKTWL